MKLCFIYFYLFFITQGVKKLRVGRLVERKTRKSKKGGKKKKKTSKADKEEKIRPKRAAVAGEAPKAPVTPAPKPTLKMKWTRIKETFIPNPWMQQPPATSDEDADGEGGAPTPSVVEYDFALLQLKKSIGGEPIQLAASPEYENIPSHKRVHYSAYEHVKKGGGEPRLYYRTCVVKSQSSQLMYHECDSVRSAAGAGIYVRMYNREAKKWDRRVVGIYTGSQWVEGGAEGGSGAAQEFNTGVRLDANKLAQICLWKTGAKKCDL